MNDRSHQSQQISEPPPLPTNGNGAGVSTKVLAAIGTSIALLLSLLLILWVNTPPLLKTASSTGAPGTETHATTDSTGAGGLDALTRQAGDLDANQEAEALRANEIKDFDSINSIAGQQGIPTEQQDNVSTKLAALDERSPTQLSQNDIDQERSENQFFTLGDSRGRTSSSVTNGSRPNSAPIIDAFAGRAAGSKEEMLRAYGGTAATEAAVKLGLEWLARNQQEDGLWSLSGPYKDGSPAENSAAATAMALLAFQGAGHTHRGDRDEGFTRVVSRGSNALLKNVIENDENREDPGRGSGYAQAMCTIALCELYGMTHDQRLRKPAIQAVQYCLTAQSPQGGWRYVPRQDSDTSVTGWFVMGLQSGKMAGLKVPNQAFENVSAYLNGVGNDNGSRYSYQPRLAATPSMTAEALLCRQYLGWQHDDPRLQDGAQYLLADLPDWKSRDVYCWYYATQVCHHMGGDYWQRWNSVMRDVLPSNQIKEGPESGSWDPKGDRWGTQGGRLYETCMCLFMLEVYYRYLPLYQESAIGRSK